MNGLIRTIGRVIYFWFLLNVAHGWRSYRIIPTESSTFAADKELMLFSAELSSSKPDNYIDISMTTLKDLLDVMMVVQVTFQPESGNNDMMVLNRTLNLCGLINGTERDDQIEWIWNDIHKKGNFASLKKCPIVAEKYEALAFDVDEDKFPVYIPDCTFKVNITLAGKTETDGQFTNLVQWNIAGSIDNSVAINKLKHMGLG